MRRKFYILCSQPDCEVLALLYLLWVRLAFSYYCCLFCEFLVFESSEFYYTSFQIYYCFPIKFIFVLILLFCEWVIYEIFVSLTLLPLSVEEVQVVCFTTLISFVPVYCIVVGFRRLMSPDALQPKAYCKNPCL